jgi:hypothetical protein
MEGKPGCSWVHGVEVPPEERTPLVERLLDVIHRLAARVEELEAQAGSLTAEVQRLRGLPETPRRGPASPSGLNEPHPPSQGKRKKRRRGKRPGSAKRSKTGQLPVTETRVLLIDSVPEGARLCGHRDYYVQDLRCEAQHICFRRARYLFPDGSRHTAPLPAEIHGHFGPGLRAYVLYQHYQNHVTQPLILEELREFGIDISAGEVDRLLCEGHDAFHAEKDALLPAAREVSAYFHTDDTPSRHQGQPGHTHHIGNEFFASFTTTQTKSRVNFLQILCWPYEEYVLNSDTLFYLEYHGLPEKVRRRLKADCSVGEAWVWDDEAAWSEQLDTWKLTDPEQQRLVTEAALFACLMDRQLYLKQPLVSDDAGQFKVLGLLNALCWLHAERHVARMIPLTQRERRAWNQTRDAIWNYYQRLKAYRQSPTARRRAALERDFDRIFLRATGWPELNEVLRRLHDRKQNLLLVLDHPEIPLHNNLSESDIREWAKKRKISAGTRSDLGRRCRDTFLSLKKTCRKLGISFWHYLQDRIRGLGQIASLPQAISTTANRDSQSPPGVPMA